MKKTILIILALAVLGFLYWTISPFFITKTADDHMVAGSVVSASVEVVDTPSHPASGSVVLVTNPDGSQAIRYEGYSTLNGPDLFVYLAKDTSAKEFITLGPVRATEGNVMYDIPEGVNVAEYPYVLTWCRAFSTLFNYADLTPIISEGDNGDELCAQVVTSAQNPETSEIREFPTPCDVPDDWQIVQPEGLDLEVI